MDKKAMIEEIYKITKKFRIDDKSHLYEAERVGTDNSNGLKYLAKRYTDEQLLSGLDDRERIISQDLENRSGKSIVIPILSTEKIGNHKYNIMQFKGNGVFVEEIIPLLKCGNIAEYDRHRMAISITQEILHSLEMLHHYYLHLDIHPGNVFLESFNLNSKEAGHAKFIDFANATMVKQIPEREAYHYGVTEYFSAPELIMGENWAISEATDLYSVCALFSALILDDYRLATESEEFVIQSEQEAVFDKIENPIFAKMLQSAFKIGLAENPDYRFSDTESMCRFLQEMETSDCLFYERKYYDLLKLSYRLMVRYEDDICCRLFEVFREDTYIQAVFQLSKDLNSNIIKPRECFYIHKYLWNAFKIKQIKNQRVAVSLLSSGIACCNHLGKAELALAYISELESLKSIVPIMDYLTIQNRAAVLYHDRYEYEKANAIAEKNIKSLEELKKSYRIIADFNEMAEDSCKITSLGRAYSVSAVGKVFMKKEDPMPYFERALEEFGEDKGNRMITIAHILHYAMESKKRELYEKYATEFFSLRAGQESYTRMDLQEIRSYKLFIYLKSIYVFYREQVDDSFYEKLLELEGILCTEDIGIHPYELIYKYMALLMLSCSKHKKEAERFFLKSVSVIDEGIIDTERSMNIIMCISYQTLSLYYKLIGDKDKEKEIKQTFMKHLSQDHWDKMYEYVKQKSTDVSALLNGEYS